MKGSRHNPRLHTQKCCDFDARSHTSCLPGEQLTRGRRGQNEGGGDRTREDPGPQVIQIPGKTLKQVLPRPKGPTSSHSTQLVVPPTGT